MKCYNCKFGQGKRAYKIYDARELYYRVHFVCNRCFINIINHKYEHLRAVDDER